MTIHKNGILAAVSFFFIFMALGASGAFAAESVKIGVFDMQKILRESKTVEGYREKFSRQIDARKKPIQEKEAAARELEDKLRKGADMIPADRQSVEEKLANESKIIKRMKEDFDSDFQKTDRELAQKAVAEIGGVARKLAEKEALTVLLEKSAGGVVYSKDSVDITAKIVSAYDEAMKKP